ncbi:MAG: LysR family transcriptional regulator [Burkholderiales bacterium]|nr:LysR family transcriptional regulator [Burkholderiales bacterium]
MTLQELKYIVAVAEERHFRRAAERSFVSQPSLSASVRKLEDELGIKIFERGPGEVLLTEVGEQVVAQARRVLEEAENVKAVAKQRRDPLVGVLRFGVIHTIAPYLLPDLVVGLRAAAPGMPLDIEENMTANLDQMLRSGLIDVAILALPYAATGIETQPLYDEAFRVVVPAGHPWARRKAIHPDELHGQNLLLLSIGHCFRDQVMDACHEFSRPASPGKEGNSLETLRSMVASGLGISVLPASAALPRYASPLVKVLDFAEPRPVRRVVIAYRSGFPRLDAIRVIVETIKGLSLPITPLPAA